MITILEPIESPEEFRKLWMRFSKPSTTLEWFPAYDADGKANCPKWSGNYDDTSVDVICICEHNDGLYKRLFITTAYTDWNGDEYYWHTWNSLHKSDCIKYLQWAYITKSQDDLKKLLL